MPARLKTLLTISVIIFLVIALHYIGWLRGVENFLRRLINPGSTLFYEWSVTVGEGTETFKNLEELQAAYTALKEKTAEQAVDTVAVTLLEEENQELREQLKFFSSVSYEHVGARVIGKNIDPIGTTIVIDKGSANGISIGNPAIVKEGILIGKIVRVEEASAVVQLISDNQSKIAATILNKDKSIGLVEGGYGISVRMNFIPQNEVVRIGETIITSGLEKEIPRGLLIGTIESVEKETYQPFQEAVLSPFVDLGKLSIVSIITRK